MSTAGQPCLTTLLLASFLQHTLGSDTIRCYSCMSSYYETHWPALRPLYHEPVNFTDACNNQTDNIAFVHCPSVCVKIHERNSVAGMWVNGFIRGCYDHVLTRGFNNTIVIRDRWLQIDKCFIYRDRRTVLNLSPGGHAQGAVTVCTCYGDACNGHNPSCTSAGATPVHSALTAVVLLLLLLLLLGHSTT